MKRFRVLPVLLIWVLLPGCTSVDSMRNRSDAGSVRVYTASYHDVFQAAQEACGRLDLSIDESDETKGYLIATHGWHGFSAGERVGIYLRSLDAQQVQVRVVSDLLLATNVIGALSDPEFGRKIPDEIQSILSVQTKP